MFLCATETFLIIKHSTTLNELLMLSLIGVKLKCNHFFDMMMRDVATDIFPLCQQYCSFIRFDTHNNTESVPSASQEDGKRGKIVSLFEVSGVFLRLIDSRSL